MKILLTGVTGYIGRRLFDILIRQGHTLYCLARNPDRFIPNLKDNSHSGNYHVYQADVTDMSSLEELPKDFDVAYYLIHALTNKGDFSEKEANMAQNFTDFLATTDCKQCIYLGGIANDDDLSDHLNSRLQTEVILKSGPTPVTAYRAGIIIGSGSASFEIIRDLVEKLPVMIAPKWLKTKCQPLAVRNVLEYLAKAANNEKTFNQVYDIGGDEILTYREMLLGYAKVRNLKRYIKTVPVMSPKMSSYWLYFVTSVSYNLAINLVDSMKNDVLVKLGNIDDVIPIDKIKYEEAIALAFDKIQQNAVVSSWSDTISSGELTSDELLNIQVPEQGVYTDVTATEFQADDTDQVLNNLWRIGGKTGWYGMDWAWNIRGFMDKLVGGVGKRRGRRSETNLLPGDALDFWRVIVADKKEGRLLLFAEMKVPGDAWLEFKIIKKDDQRSTLVQTATFRPLGLAGRLYWYLMYPAHIFIFPMMSRAITNAEDQE